LNTELLTLALQGEDLRGFRCRNIGECLPVFHGLFLTEAEITFLMLACHCRPLLSQSRSITAKWGLLSRGRTASIHINEHRFMKLIKSTDYQALYENLFIGVKLLNQNGGVSASSLFSIIKDFDEQYRLEQNNQRINPPDSCCRSSA